MNFKVDYKLESQVTTLCYADDNILLATLEAKIQKLVDCLDQVSRKYSLIINVDKTKGRWVRSCTLVP